MNAERGMRGAELGTEASSAACGVWSAGACPRFGSRAVSSTGPALSLPKGPARRPGVCKFESAAAAAHSIWRVELRTERRLHG